MDGNAGDKPVQKDTIYWEDAGKKKAVSVTQKIAEKLGKQIPEKGNQRKEPRKGAKEPLIWKREQWNEETSKESTMEGPRRYNVTGSLKLGVQLVKFDMAETINRTRKKWSAAESRMSHKCA